MSPAAQVTRTKEGILAGTVDATQVKMKELRAFIEENKLGIVVKPGKSKVDVLNMICDVMDPAGSSPTAPGYLARRATQIAAEKKATSAADGGTGIDPGAYEGEKVPEFIKRRMNKEEG